MLGGLAVAAGAPQSGHAVHPPMPGQEYTILCRLETPDKPIIVEAPLKLASPTVPATLEQIVQLPAPLAPIKLVQYLPSAKLKQDVLPDKSKKSPPAVQISVEGPTQSYQAWLAAGDPERNRLVSLIGTWRYMAVGDVRQRDDLFGQFQTELTRDPRIIVSRGEDGAHCELPLRIGESQTAGSLGCKIRVRSFFGHFAMDDKTRKPTNVSDKRLNPAALVEVEDGSTKEERWVFAKFPEFARDKAPSGRYQVVLDCPIDKLRESPDFAIVTTGNSRHDVWLRSRDKITSKPAETGSQFEIVGSQYRFRITRFVESGKLVEEYSPAESRDAVPAVRIESVDMSGSPVTVWLALGKNRVLLTVLGPMTVTFGDKLAGPQPQHP
jgi:hypothetical protein